MWVLGHFDQQGNACLKFHLCGVHHQDPGVEFEGLIDTGFTGFIQLPIQHAFQLKLPLNGTASITLADAHNTVCLTALARTTFDGETVVGVVSLEMQSQEILIGMDFLRQFKKGLVVTKGLVIITEEDWLDKIINANQSGQATPAEENPISENPPASSPTEPKPPA